MSVSGVDIEDQPLSFITVWQGPAIAVVPLTGEIRFSVQEHKEDYRKDDGDDGHKSCPSGVELRVDGAADLTHASHSLGSLQYLLASQRGRADPGTSGMTSSPFRHALRYSNGLT